VPDISDKVMKELRQPEMILSNTSGDVLEIALERQLAFNPAKAMIAEYEARWSNKCFADIEVDESVDIREVWEPARLQYISTMIAVGREAEDFESASVANGAKEAVLDWLYANPFLLGPHYMSAMECGLRIPVFFYCLKSVNSLSGTERLQLLAAIYEHAWWVSHRLSLYSSIGNHTVAESVGLLFAGTIFRGTGEGQAWLDKGLQLLRQELYHQILDDGGPAEQSFSYHGFVLDLYWLAVDFLEKNHLYDCASWKSRLMLGEAFLSAFEYAGRLPSIGDSDNGYAIAHSVAPRRPEIATKPQRLRSFPVSGYTVLRTANDCLLIFDHGPLGMAPLYNHGHADALSVILRKAGQEMLVDPGTYRYNGPPEWRRYFKGTRAHNTVTVDGLDQAIQETSFVWSKPYRTELLKAVEEGEVVVLQAVHNGYGRLKEPIYHKRTVILLNGKDFLVKDTFSGKGTHQFELNFHLHPYAEIQEESEWLKIRKNKAEVGIALLSGGRFNIVRGQDSSPFCWFSPRYGVKVASAALTCPKQGLPGEVTFLTVISTSNDRPDLSRMRETAWQI
jgi:hypothetical protein